MRDITQLHPTLQKKANELVKACEKKGYKIKITECLRTQAEQDELYAQGRTKSGKIVTNVKYPNSMHNWGVAFDICRNDGKGAYENGDKFFEKVGAIGQSLGLEWGGAWKSFVDLPHFQLKDWGSTPTNLKKIYVTPEVFIKTWSKDSNPSPNKQAYSGKYPVPTLRIKARGVQVEYLQKYLNWYFEKSVCTADGIFGNVTEKYLKKFQTENKACGSVDGIMGNKTLSAMKSVKK